MTFGFQHPTVLLTLALVPAVVVLCRHGAARRALSLAQFSETLCPTSAAVRMAGISHRLHGIASAIALTFLIIAMARPGWQPRQDVLTKSGRDVVFVLDVSRSMLAEDRVPNRLENMRVAVRDCVSAFEGNRVALAVFAGSPAIKCPLTSDYEFFETALRDVSPLSTSHGGTRVGDALHRVIDKLLLDDMQGFQDVILITDGGDQASQPAGAIDDLNAKRAGLIVIGVGDAQRGTRIPIRDGDSGELTYVRYDSRDVVTRQDNALLLGLVEACDNGLYLDAGTRPIDLANVYTQFAAHMGQRVFTTDSVDTLEEEFPLFLAVAVLALLLSRLGPPLVSCRLRRAVAQVSVAVLLLTTLTAAASGDATYLEARRAYEAGDFTKAQDLFAAACAEFPFSAELRHHLGNAQYRAGAYTNAVGSYVQALAMTTQNDLQFRCCYNIGNCLVRIAEDGSREEAGASAEQLAQAVRYYRAALEIHPADADAAWNLECALYRSEELKQQQRLRAAREKELQQREEGETSEGDAPRAAESEDDVIGEETEAEADTTSVRPPATRARACDLQSRTLPPPNITPEQVLMEEEAVNALREKGRGRAAAKVKKDW